MKNRIKIILISFIVFALISIAVAGILLVLDIGAVAEIKDALSKVIYVLGILTAFSLAVLGITKFNK